MTSVQPPRPDQPDPADYAYNLFRNKQRPDIICAVPEDRPVPHFIDQERWTFEQPLRPLQARPPGFDSKAAHTGVRFNGFYLFYAIASAPIVQAALDILSGGL
jgi:hypothetical protein